jgi:hypothetical protein
MSDPPTERPASSVDPKLLEILVCPLTKGPLEYDAAKQELISRKARPCAGHPRLKAPRVTKSWMAGTSPAMTG